MKGVSGLKAQGSAHKPLFDTTICIDSTMKPSPIDVVAASPRRCIESPSRRPSAARGFTLIELMVSLSVLCILTSLAAASMSSTLSNNNIYATQTEFVAALAMARSEALSRGLPVMVGASAAAPGNSFGGGWTVWVDSNSTGSFDVQSDPVLRSHEALPPNIQVGDGTTTTFGFTAMGFLVGGTAIDIKVCPSDSTVAGFDITIQPNGIVDVADVAANAMPCSGS